MGWLLVLGRYVKFIGGRNSLAKNGSCILVYSSARRKTGQNSSQQVAMFPPTNLQIFVKCIASILTVIQIYVGKINNDMRSYVFKLVDRNKQMQGH